MCVANCPTNKVLLNGNCIDKCPEGLVDDAGVCKS